MDTSDLVIEKVRKYFIDNGIPIIVVAEKLGVSQQAVTNIFRRGNYFGNNAALKWSTVFGFDYTYLRTGKGSLFPEEMTEEKPQQEQDGVFIPERTMKFFEDLQETCRNLSAMANRLTSGDTSQKQETPPIQIKKDRFNGGHREKL